MDEMNIREYLENHKLLTDGAMGTYFDTVEKENYICSEEANITNPSLVRQIHKNYVKNGAQLLSCLLYTSTAFIEALEYAIKNPLEI